MCVLLNLYLVDSAIKFRTDISISCLRASSISSPLNCTQMDLGSSEQKTIDARSIQIVASVRRGVRRSEAVLAPYGTPLAPWMEVVPLTTYVKARWVPPDCILAKKVRMCLLSRPL
jgi:hypothetical protein